MRTYLICLAAVVVVCAGFCQAGPNVQFVEHPDRIDVMVDGRHFTSYLHRDDLTKPILYPLRTPCGIVVNRSYPLEKVEGETTDHPHHAGISFTYDQVNGNGFWNNTKSLPQIKHVKVTKMKAGSGRGRLSTVAHWLDKNGQVLLQESRDMVFIAGPNEYAIDLDIRLKAPNKKVVFKDTKEGMFAIRVADWLRERSGSGIYLNSNGDEKEKGVWGKRAEWLRLQGKKNGKVLGIAIFHHPDSVNYPTYWHARGYGLFSANPLGQYDFEKKRNPKQAKPFNFTLQPGQTGRFRFLVLVYEGERTKEQLDGRFKAFAEPVKRQRPADIGAL